MLVTVAALCLWIVALQLLCFLAIINLMMNLKNKEFNWRVVKYIEHRLLLGLLCKRMKMTYMYKDLYESFLEDSQSLVLLETLKLIDKDSVEILIA